MCMVHRPMSCLTLKLMQQHWTSNIIYLPWKNLTTETVLSKICPVFFRFPDFILFGKQKQKETNKKTHTKQNKLSLMLKVSKGNNNNQKVTNKHTVKQNNVDKQNNANGSRLFCSENWFLLKGLLFMTLSSGSEFAEAEWNEIWLSQKDVGRIQPVCLFVRVKVLTLSLRVAVTWCCLDSSPCLLPPGDLSL